MAWIRCSGNMGGRTELKTATGSVAVFNTNLPAPVIDAKSDIGYSAKGYRSATIVNTSNTPALDSTPYLYRPSYANGYGYETLIGGTCGVNQLVQNGNFADTSEWTSTGASLTVASNIGTVALSGNWGRISQNLNGDRRLNGKYLINCAIKANSSGDVGKKVRIGLAKSDTTDFDYRSYDLTDSWTTVNYLINSSYATANYLMFTGNNNICTFDLKNANVIDLTAYFGTTIADYVYTLETNTSGAGITWLKNNGFFGADYYPYNAGGLLSVKTSKKINTGKNLYNKGVYPFEQYSIYNPTVCWTSSFYLLAGTYTHSCSTGFGTCFINVYPTKADADGNTNRISQNSFSDGGSKTETYSSGVWVRVQQNNTGGTQTDYDKVSNSWQIEFGNQATAYKSYTANEYPLDDIELRGILKLDGNNNLVYDGDTYESNGSVTRKYGIVDLGSVNWLRATSSGTVNYFYIQNSELPSLNIKEESYPTSLNLVCPIYITKSNNNSIASALNTDMTMCRNQTNICIRNDTYSTPEQFKTAMNGVYLVYELATPTTETADTFTNPMIVDGNGTEEFVDTRAVQMPVGHETIYGEDMKARFTGFGVTVFGGSIDFTSGTLISDKNADGTAKTPETISVTPVALETRKGTNNICSNTNGNSTIKYVDYGT